MYAGYFAEHFGMDSYGLSEWVWPWEERADWNVLTTLTFWGESTFEVGEEVCDTFYSGGEYGCECTCIFVEKTFEYSVTLSGFVATVGIAGIQYPVEFAIGDNWGESWRHMFDKPWVEGRTGGIVPPYIRDGIDSVREGVSTDAYKNGWHSWHAGSNAYLVEEFGLIGVPFIFLGGVFHETSFDSDSYQAEEKCQGTVNHILDSNTDIIANIWGISLGILLPRGLSIPFAIDTGNWIPGPEEADENFGGNGRKYDNNPWARWWESPDSDIPAPTPWPYVLPNWPR